MSTPIETNTEELQEILQTVYNLPTAGGGSSEPDLVIGLNVTDTKVFADGATNNARDLLDMTVDDVSIISGSVSATAEKVKQGLPVRVLIRSVHFYWSNSWFSDVGEATQVLIGNSNSYPNDDYRWLFATFFLSNCATALYHPVMLRITFDLTTGTVYDYKANMFNVE